MVGVTIHGQISKYTVLKSRFLNRPLYHPGRAQQMGVGRKRGSADSKDTLWGRLGLVGACPALSRSRAPSSLACWRYRCCAEHVLGHLEQGH
jgi:hypothetical protein